MKKSLSVLPTVLEVIVALTIPRTASPRPMSCLHTSEPIKPLAPVTSIRMTEVHDFRSMVRRVLTGLAGRPLGYRSPPANKLLNPSHLRTSIDRKKSLFKDIAIMEIFVLGDTTPEHISVPVDNGDRNGIQTRVL